MKLLSTDKKEISPAEEARGQLAGALGLSGPRSFHWKAIWFLLNR